MTKIKCVEDQNYLSNKRSANKPAFWFMLSGKKMLMEEHEGNLSVPIIQSPENVGLTTVNNHYLGTFNGQPCYTGRLQDNIEVPAGMASRGVWGLFNHLEAGLFNMALRAVHILEWDQNSQYCSHCGAQNTRKEDERAKVCPQCGYISFPRISPAVIVLLEKDNQILLARAPRFKEEMYSVLAGFVEPGETLEETVKREIKEEVGIDVTDIRYFGSQPWPFPDSLMIAFTAKYAGGEISIDRSEIVTAGWFSIEDLPPIPGKISIARRMIDWFIEKQERIVK